MKRLYFQRIFGLANSYFKKCIACFLRSVEYVAFFQTVEFVEQMHNEGHNGARYFFFY